MRNFGKHGVQSLPSATWKPKSGGFQHKSTQSLTSSFSIASHNFWMKFLHR